MELVLYQLTVMKLALLTLTASVFLTTLTDDYEYGAMMMKTS